MNDLIEDIPSDDSNGTDLSDNSPIETLDLPLKNDSGNTMLGNLPENVPEDIPEDDDLETLDIPSESDTDGQMAGDISENVPDDIPEDDGLETLDIPSESAADDQMAGDISENVPDDIPEDDGLETLDRPSESAADDQMAGNISENVPDDIPEDDGLETLDLSPESDADDQMAGDMSENVPDDIPEDENRGVFEIPSRNDMKGSMDGDISGSIQKSPFEEISDTNDTSDTNHPIESLSDYMNAHHYGSWDYPTYSQDPVWRNLMRNEFPDHELPEISPDRAIEQLSEYMNCHKYAHDDFDEYSKDPVWQELNQAAFPDLQRQDLYSEEKKDEFPKASSVGANHVFPTPVADCLEESGRRTGDIPRVSGLDDHFLSGLPENRRNVIDMAYKDAPPEMISEINDRLDDMMPVADTGYSLDKNSQLVKDGCYYSPQDHQVRMDEMLDPDEYAEVLPHEMTHFLDHTRGWESHSPEFSNALVADVARMNRGTPEGRMLFNEMLDDAFNTGAAYDRNISDIIHGAFRNDPEIMSRYYTEGAMGSEYSHWDGYWDNPFAREEETYANCGAIMCANSRIGKNFLERYYPNTGSQFNKFYNI